MEGCLNEKWLNLKLVKMKRGKNLKESKWKVFKIKSLNKCSQNE